MKLTNHKWRFEIYRRHMHKTFELCCVLSCFADCSSTRPLTACRVSTTTGAGPTCPLGTAAGLVTTGSSSLAGVGHLIRSGVAACLAGTALVGHGATSRLAAAVSGWVAAHCRGSLACHFFDLEQWRHGDYLMWRCVA